MEVITLNSNEMAQNAYLYFDPQSKEGVVIDPGDNEQDILAAIESKGINLQCILLTHGHYDHIYAADEVKAQTNTPIVCHRNESAVLADPNLNLSVMIDKNISVTSDRELDDGGEITIGAGKLKVIHTPGHTPGGICFYDEENEMIFTGDTLFMESIGRSDMHMGDHDTLIGSINQKLMTLPESVKVFSGHGLASTIGHEKANNPFIR